MDAHQTVAHQPGVPLWGRATVWWLSLPQRLPMRLNLGERAGSDGKRERAGASLSPFQHSPRAAVSLSPQAYGQEAFTVEASAEERGLVVFHNFSSLFIPL